MRKTPLASTLILRYKGKAMNQYSRKSSGIALVLTMAAGLTALAATGQFHTGDPGSVDQLERAIASGHGDVHTWAAYGTALQADKRFDHAAQAYQRALDLQPDPSDAQKIRFNAALCFGQAGDADKFFDFFSHLTTTSPKLAVDVLERPELAPLHNDARWGPAASLARAQAAD
jgi:Tfp pilus assembly protein PilF